MSGSRDQVAELVEEFKELQNKINNLQQAAKDEHPDIFEELDTLTKESEEVDDHIRSRLKILGDQWKHTTADKSLQIGPYRYTRRYSTGYNAEKFLWHLLDWGSRPLLKECLDSGVLKLSVSRELADAFIQRLKDDGTLNTPDLVHALTMTWTEDEVEPSIRRG